MHIEDVKRNQAYRRGGDLPRCMVGIDVCSFAAGIDTMQVSKQKGRAMHGPAFKKVCEMNDLFHCSLNDGYYSFNQFPYLCSKPIIFI